MRFKLGVRRDLFWFVFNPRHFLAALVMLSLTGFASVASAQQLITPVPSCQEPKVGIEAYPAPNAMTYPATSDQYAMQYKLDNGTWTTALVYNSVYGGSNSSPWLNDSGYPEGLTSMSFSSIPARANAYVQLRVTKLGNGPFVPSDQVSVRPSAKPILANLSGDGTAQIATLTGPNFAGEQFILYWSRDSQHGGGIQGLVFFLNPPYQAPTGRKVLPVSGYGDLTGDLSSYDTLAFQGTVTIGDTGDAMHPHPLGAEAFVVPGNINNVYLGPGAWVQGKLLFAPSSTGHRRRIYGPGVLDVSRFEYDLRKCSISNDPDYADQGDPALAGQTKDGDHGALDQFDLDGIIITDNNFYATDSLSNSTVNDVKVIAWNGNNDGLQFGDNTTVSNVFVRSGDDSLKMWGSSDVVTNATVWQNYNGGVVNLGWFNNSPGDNGLIDGLYVVKTDWSMPNAPDPSFMALESDPVAHQNNGIIASMMVPGTQFGAMHPSLYRNIFVEDAPQVLFSLKIVPPRMSANTDGVPLTDSSTLNLNIENLFTPPSTVASSIGFQILPGGYTFGIPVQTFTSNYTLTGSMKINLTNVILKMPHGNLTPLTAANAAAAGFGNINTNPDNLNIHYDFAPSALLWSLLSLVP
jgi:hypothetical protein